MVETPHKEVLSDAEGDTVSKDKDATWMRSTTMTEPRKKDFDNGRITMTRMKNAIEKMAEVDLMLDLSNTTFVT